MFDISFADKISRAYTRSCKALCHELDIPQTAFDRIGFLIGPYAAGPYAEGSYDVTLPVTPAVIAAVKPEFRTAFAAGR